ncbi:MAG: hypothetical protein SOU48_04675 [Prevotella sp.]|nr:hypothetical protein [Prevotella sp.]
MKKNSCSVSQRSSCKGSDASDVRPASQRGSACQHHGIASNALENYY